ncbi:hypothetical protein PanWU01x14_319620 [Parasponia andersonii]|uniref:Uncharacterized protein n=1 Tax=Parasponia andersonii TaxID=3476 RepID=A0A2P5ALS7_PARAD|nr:hypothetical protein PanWU01x14_319620 [Parasponia andersonii]
MAKISLETLRAWPRGELVIPVWFMRLFLLLGGISAEEVWLTVSKDTGLHRVAHRLGNDTSFVSAMVEMDLREKVRYFKKIREILTSGK